MNRQHSVEGEAIREPLPHADDDLLPDDSSDLGNPPDPAAHDYVTLELLEDQSTLELYLQEVWHIPLLTREQEVSLAKQMEQGRIAQAELDESRALGAQRRDELIEQVEVGDAAREQLVKANSRLVISLAKRYAGRGLPLLDLIQEGYLGLMRAVDKFDHRRGHKLSTYATWWIRHTVSRAIAEHGGTIRLPAHIGERIRKMAAVSTQLSQELGRDPSHDELASEMGFDPDQVDLIMRARIRPVSFEDLLWNAETGDTPYSVIEDKDALSPSEALSRLDLHDAIDEAFSTLTLREERVLTLRFGLRGSYPHKLAEVGEKFGLTRERIRQIERDALEKLRQPHRRDLLEDYVA